MTESNDVNDSQKQQRETQINNNLSIMIEGLKITNRQTKFSFKYLSHYYNPIEGTLDVNFKFSRNGFMPTHAFATNFQLYSIDTSKPYAESTIITLHYFVKE